MLAASARSSGVARDSRRTDANESPTQTLSEQQHCIRSESTRKHTRRHNKHRRCAKNINITSMIVVVRQRHHSCHIYNTAQAVLHVVKKSVQFSRSANHEMNFSLIFGPHIGILCCVISDASNRMENSQSPLFFLCHSETARKRRFLFILFYFHDDRNACCTPPSIILAAIILIDVEHAVRSLPVIIIRGFLTACSAPRIWLREGEALC